MPDVSRVIPSTRAPCSRSSSRYLLPSGFPETAAGRIRMLERLRSLAAGLKSRRLPAVRRNMTADRQAIVRGGETPRLFSEVSPLLEFCRKYRLAFSLFSGVLSVRLRSARARTRCSPHKTHVCSHPPMGFGPKPFISTPRLLSALTCLRSISSLRLLCHRTPSAPVIPLAPTRLVEPIHHMHTIDAHDGPLVQGHGRKSLFRESVADLSAPRPREQALRPSRSHPPSLSCLRPFSCVHHAT